MHNNLSEAGKCFKQRQKDAWFRRYQIPLKLMQGTLYFLDRCLDLQTRCEFPVQQYSPSLTLWIVAFDLS